MKKYPVIYYFKDDSSNGIDLKYSIRSVVQNFPYEKIYILGDKPKWFLETDNIMHFPSETPHGFDWTIGWIPFQHMNNMLKLDLDFDEFILFNDDFFVTKPIKEFQDYCRNKKDYDQRAAINRMYHARTRRSLTLTKGDKYFNLHCPMRMKVSSMREMIDFWKKAKVKDLDFRTLYGNMFIEEYPNLKPVDDFKSSYIRKDLLDPSLREYYSTSSQDFIPSSVSEIAKKIKEMFPNYAPCEKIEKFTTPIKKRAS